MLASGSIVLWAKVEVQSAIYRHEFVLSTNETTGLCKQDSFGSGGLSTSLAQATIDVLVRRFFRRGSLSLWACGAVLSDVDLSSSQSQAGEHSLTLSLLGRDLV